METRVHFDLDAWCIITVCGESAFTVDTQSNFTEGKWFYFPRTVHVERGFPR